MRSIGMSLAAAPVDVGCRPVTFLGRRAESNEQVKNDLAGLPEKASGQCHSRQVDVCDKAFLKKVLIEINMAYGCIKNIVHSTAVARGSGIKTTDLSSFSDVFRPKVIGSWNLQLAGQELDLALDSFLCNSISVIVGNPGQIAYVATSSFMDPLVACLHNCGLPGTSLQGAWESKLITKIDMNNSFAHFMKNEGLPLVMKAMALPIPVQINAKMDKKRACGCPACAKDHFFAPLLEALEAKPVVPNKVAGAKSRLFAEYARKPIVNVLRKALELQVGEPLDLSNPLTALGADLITFAQSKGQVLQQFEVDVPMLYLCDAYSIGDTADYIEKYAAQIWLI